MISFFFSARLSSLLLTLLLSLFAAGSVLAQEQPFVADLENVEWGPPAGGDGFPLGLQTVRLGIDEKTLGVTYYAKFPAGSHFDLHWHTHHEYVAVVKGEVELQLGTEIHRLKTGSYIVIPGGVNHYWDVPESADVVILVRRAGPADFHFVEASQ
jgi:quercetin dioxygenase-like cupin family protein